jgi:hypothetical protein
MKAQIYERAAADRRVGDESWRVVLLSLLCLVMAFGSRVDAATTDEKLAGKFVGKNWVNGRSWEKLDYAGKLGYVCGLFDGITLLWAAAEAGRKNDLDSVYHSLRVPSNLTVGDVVKGMDEFYGDEANARLPAICAYLYYAYQSRGDSREAQEKRLILWRRMFSQ